MNEITEWIFLSAVIVVIVVAVWHLTDPLVWRRISNWFDKRAGIEVRVTITIGNKEVYTEDIEIGMTRMMIGRHRIYPEKFLKDELIVPRRYLSSKKAYEHPPIRVEKNRHCVLKVEKLEK